MVRNKPFSVVSGTKFGICCQLEFIGVFLCVNQQKRCNTRFWQRKESDSHWADVWNTTKWKHITGCTTHLGGCKSCQPVTVETWNVRACSVLLSLSRWRSSHVKYADWIYECQILFLLILRRVESDYCLQWMRWNDLGGEDNLDSGKFLGFSINAFIAINSFLAHINDRQQTRAQIRVILWKYHAVLDKFREKAHILVLMIVLSESPECGGYTEVIAERVWRMRGAHRSMECSWPRRGRFFFEGKLGFYELNESSVTQHEVFGFFWSILQILEGSDVEAGWVMGTLRNHGSRQTCD